MKTHVQVLIHECLDFFNQFEKLHPVTSAFNMPIYSNVAWQVLAYAIEGMTNKTFAEHLEASLTRPLNLTGTFLSPPPRTTTLNAIIPGNEIESWWALDAGDGTSSAYVTLRQNIHPTIDSTADYSLHTIELVLRYPLELISRLSVNPFFHLRFYPNHSHANG